MLISAVATLTLLSTAVIATYVIEDDYASDSFAGMFDFFTVRLSAPQWGPSD